MRLWRRVKAALGWGLLQVKVWSGVKISHPLFLVNSTFTQNLLSYPSASLPFLLTIIPESPP